MMIPQFIGKDLMQKALIQAELAYVKDEVPVGAIIVDQNYNIISTAHNEKEMRFDPCAHAEVLAIQRASSNLKSWRLLGCHLIVTLEPCLMCLSAAIHGRLNSVTFGAYDKKTGAISLNYSIHVDLRLNHQLTILGGIEEESCSKLLKSFFKEKRKL